MHKAEPSKRKRKKRKKKKRRKRRKIATTKKRKKKVVMLRPKPKKKLRVMAMMKVRLKVKLKARVKVRTEMLRMLVHHQKELILREQRKLETSTDFTPTSMTPEKTEREMKKSPVISLLTTMVENQSSSKRLHQPQIKLPRILRKKSRKWSSRERPRMKKLLLKIMQRRIRKKRKQQTEAELLSSR